MWAGIVGGNQGAEILILEPIRENSDVHYVHGFLLIKVIVDSENGLIRFNFLMSE